MTTSFNGTTSDKLSTVSNDVLAGKVPYKFEKHVECWRNLPQERIENLPLSDRANINRQIENYSHSKLANLRISHLAQIARHSTPWGAKLTVKLLAAMLSALTFSAGTQVLTARLGRTSLPAALAAAAVAGYLVEDRASKAITCLRQRFDTLQALRALETSKQVDPPSNEFEDKLLQSQFQLLQHIEAASFSKHFPVDTFWASSLSLAEYITAFWIVAQLGLPGGLLLEAIASSLPIAILWITAAFQSESWELPERCNELMNKYQPHVLQSERLSEEEVRDIYALDQRIRFVSEGDPSGQFKNLGMVNAGFMLEYYSKYKQQLEQAGLQSVAERQVRHQESVAQLPSLFSRRAGVPDDEFNWEQRQWIDQQTRQLKADFDRDVEILGKHYSQQIQVCEEEIAKAQKAYQKSYQYWLNCRGYSHDDSSEYQVRLNEAR